MRDKIIGVIFIGCILLGLSFLFNKNFIEKKDTSLTEIEELEMAYQWAYNSKITSQPSIEQANLNGYVTRAQLAKMMSSFSFYVLHKVPNTGMNCEFNDVETVEPQLQLGIKQSCQLGLMGQNVKRFRPSDSVTLGEFATILTRAIWGDEFQWGEPYYKKSLQVLHKLGIIEDITGPLVDQKRGRIMLMLMRSNNLISKGKKTIDDMIYRDFYIEDIDLFSGNSIPVLGFSTWGLNNEQAESLVYEALKIGYRNIDTARDYGNEVGVGLAIKKAIDDGIITRDELFITSKAIPSNYSDPNKEVGISLDNLGLEYINLMLIHQPGANDKGLYHAFERAIGDGKVRSIGIANYYTPEEFDRMYSMARIKPVIIQNENHIFYQNTELKKYLKKYGIVFESWYALGGTGHSEEIFSNKTIKKLSEKYEKSPAQIVLRWQVQDGNVVLSSASDIEHLKENYNIFDFELTNHEMKLIQAIEKNERYENL